MLRVSTSTTTLLSSKEACRTLVPAVQLGMTSTVLAGDLALNDAAPPASLATHSRSLLRSAASHGSSVSHTSRTSENGDSIPPSPIQDSQLEEDPSSTSDDTISGALDMLDENVLPIKSQITLRKVYGVFKLLTLLRFCSMLLQPATNFSDTFPYMPVDNAGMKSTKAQINFSELPIVALFLHGSIFSFATWFSLTQELVLHFFRSVLSIAYDFFALHRLILSPETLIVVLLALLLHPLTAWMDERIQREFYDRKKHENIHQLPPWLSSWGKKGFKQIRHFLLLALVWPSSHALSHEANLVLILCTVWMSVFKRILKNLVDSMHIRPALRPPNQAFPRGMYFGGFPSGHVSQCFVAMLIVYHVWGLTNVMGIALVLQTLLTFVWVVSANRHYLSQVIAGLALGAIYGFAAIAWLHSIYGPDVYRAGYGHGWSRLGF